MTKPQEQIRAEFEAWHDALYIPYTRYPTPYEAWQARQPEIDAKNKQIEALSDVGFQLCDKIDALEAKIALLREALGDVMIHSIEEAQKYEGLGTLTEEEYPEAYHIAKKALEVQTNDNK